MTISGHPGLRRGLSRLGAAAVGSAVLVGAMLATGSAAVLATEPVQPSGCGTLPLDVELVLDRSGSMTSESNAGHTRLYWAQQAADQLVADLDAHGGVGGASGGHHVGLTSFSGTTATVEVALGNATAATVSAAINDNGSSGNTPLLAGLVKAGQDMDAGARNAVGGDVKRILILLSDGRPNPDNSTTRPNGSQIATYLGKADVAYSIAIGEGGSGATQVDLALMQLLDKPDGHYYNVVDSSDLPSLFTGIYQEIACAPGIKVVKSASSTDLPAGGGSVTFTYTVTNTGNVALNNVVVTDDKCTPVTYQSGDTGTDQVLALTETWIYQCTKTVTTSQTNTATASGCDVEKADSCAQDTDQVTVNVSSGGGVGGVTDAPTLPPTSTIATGQTGSSDSAAWIAILLLMFGGVAFLLTPRLDRSRR